MREELSEKVETVYAEEYAWPLGVALLLLMVEAAIDEAPRRRRARSRQGRRQEKQEGQTGRARRRKTRKKKVPADATA